MYEVIPSLSQIEKLLPYFYQATNLIVIWTIKSSEAENDPNGCMYKLITRPFYMERNFFMGHQLSRVFQLRAEGNMS